jgi:hypothetical protein
VIEITFSVILPTSNFPRAKVTREENIKTSRSRKCCDCSAWKNKCWKRVQHFILEIWVEYFNKFKRNCWNCKNNQLTSIINYEDIHNLHYANITIAPRLWLTVDVWKDKYKKVFVKMFNWYFQNSVRNFQLVEKIPWDLLIRLPSVVSIIYIYIGFYTTLSTLKNIRHVNYPILCFMVMWNGWRAVIY